MPIRRLCSYHVTSWTEPPESPTTSPLTCRITRRRCRLTRRTIGCNAWSPTSAQVRHVLRGVRSPIARYSLNEKSGDQPLNFEQSTRSTPKPPLSGGVASTAFAVTLDGSTPVHMHFTLSFCPPCTRPIHTHHFCGDVCQQHVVRKVSSATFISHNQASHLGPIR
jgi:hypothetical protein